MKLARGLDRFSLPWPRAVTTKERLAECAPTFSRQPPNEQPICYVRAVLFSCTAAKDCASKLPTTGGLRSKIARSYNDHPLRIEVLAKRFSNLAGGERLDFLLEFGVVR